MHSRIKLKVTTYVAMYVHPVCVHMTISIHVHMFVKYVVTQQSSAYGVNVSLAVVSILPEVDNCWSSAYFIYNNNYICVLCNFHLASYI